MTFSSDPRRFAVLFLIPFLAAGCDLLDEGEDAAPVTAGVYVANQGNFGDANGSVTVYDPETQGARTAVGEDLGSIVQSLLLHGDRLYVAANTGERIVAFDLDTFARVGQIEAVTSPRYIVPVNPQKAYVTSLYRENFTGGKVTVLDLAADAKGVEIEVGDNPEGIAVVGPRAYVAHHGFGAGRTVSVIDTQTDTVIETLDVDCDGPRFLAADADDEVWVFCTGNTLYDDDFNVIGETPGAVRVLDGATGQIRARIAVDGRIGTAGPGQDAFYAPEAQEAYAVRDSDTVLRFDTAANRLAATLGPLGGDPIGAVAYDHGSRRLYVGRVPSFTEHGAVTIHDRDGAVVGSFAAGIAPAFIAFRQESR